MNSSCKKLIRLKNLQIAPIYTAIYSSQISRTFCGGSLYGWPNHLIKYGRLQHRPWTATTASQPSFRCFSTEIDEYHERADDTMEQLLEYMESFTEVFPRADVDLAISFSSNQQGVLTFDLGPQYGTYVINKQPPNKQIWLSSPFSGPKRYDYVDGKWIYHRENQTLGDLLRQEIEMVAKENSVVVGELNVL